MIGEAVQFHNETLEGRGLKFKVNLGSGLEGLGSLLVSCGVDGGRTWEEAVWEKGSRYKGMLVFCVQVVQFIVQRRE